MSLKNFIIIYFILETCTLISNYSILLLWFGWLVLLWMKTPIPFCTWQWQLFCFRSSLLYWLSFHGCESSLHRVFTWFLFILWVVFTCVFFCLVLLMDGFPSLIFIYKVSFFFFCTNDSYCDSTQFFNVTCFYKN